MSDSDNKYEQDENIIDTTMREISVEEEQPAGTQESADGQQASDAAEEVNSEHNAVEQGGLKGVQTAAVQGEGNTSQSTDFQLVDSPDAVQDEERIRRERREEIERQRAARRAAMQGRHPANMPQGYAAGQNPYGAPGLNAGQGASRGQGGNPGADSPYQPLSPLPGQNRIPPYGTGSPGQVPPVGMPPAMNQKKRKNSEKWGALHYIAIAMTALVFGFMASAGFKILQSAAGNGGTGVSGGAIPTTAPIEKEDVKTMDSGNTTGGAVTAQVKDVSGVVDNIMPAIVAINCTVQEQYSIFGQYYGNQEASSSGSGIIVGQSDNELLIVTNNHVIASAKSISVQFIDEKVYDAQVKGVDSTADLAVVAVKTKDLTNDTRREIKISKLGDSDAVKVGEVAIAIGNALGYGQSVTVGYISAKDREVSASDTQSGAGANKMKLLQTDAAINPGNSGGALLNIQGEVIGINSIKYASEEVEGMGYAIPISIAVPIINELMGREDLKENEKGYLGISGTTVATSSQGYSMPDGVYINEVSEGGAADRAGIIKGDIITKINGIAVSSIEGLQERVNSYRAGTEVSITLQRAKEGVYQEQTVTATLQDEKSVQGLQGSQGATATPGQGNDGNGYDDYGDYFSNPFEGWFD